MAVIRTCVLVFMTLLHRNVLVLSNDIERPQSISSQPSLQHLSDKIDQLDRKLDGKFANLDKQLKDSAAKREHALNQATTDLKKEIEKLQTALRNLVHRQEGLDNELKKILEKLNNIERDLQNLLRNRPLTPRPGPHSPLTLTPRPPTNTYAAEGDVRLVGGTRTRGRVEIFHSGTWGTVCDDGWGVEEARVVCRMLGFGTYTARPIQSFGGGTGRTWMDGVLCEGAEISLSRCTHRGWGQEDCNHSEDAGVSCEAPEEVRVRLAGGTATRGRVEVLHDGRWGTVCDDSWGEPDARVVCRMLGFRYFNAEPLPRYGGGTGPTWMDNVECKGGESSISHCPFRGWGQEDCSHREDAGVECHIVEPGTVRLAGGTPTRGRVEVFHDGRWGTVCDNDWDDADASVVCKMLGFRKHIPKAIRAFGGGTGQIWMDNVRCRGDESALSRCTFRGWGQRSCGHREDAGVECKPTEHASEGTLRLVNGPPFSGRVEIFHNGRWGTVCNDEFGTPDAEVVCRQMGYKGGKVATRSYGSGVGDVWMDAVRCDGHERRLADCRFDGWGNEDCSHAEDVGVQCTSPDTPTTPPPIPEGKVRLAGGTSTRGRVEIFHGGRWGTVCDANWDDADASVVCRMLGFRNHIPKAIRTFGGGNGQIWMDSVNCRGEESALSSCPFKGWGTVSCSHRDDAGVECKPRGQASEGDIRLVNGPAFAGRVEIFHNNRWGTVCNDEFGTQDAEVVCRQMGYKGGKVATRSYGAGTGDTWMDGVRCDGHERRLADCRFDGWGIEDCSHTEDVGVQCTSPTAPTTRPPIADGTVRLAGGTTTRGRVEIFHDGRWGTVCDESWGDVDAGVVCRMLGFRDHIPKAIRAFGGGAGQIWMDIVNCRGQETSLSQCPFRGWGQVGCGHRNDAGVECKPPPPANEGDIRLVNGPPFAGRVEIHHNNRWGTVCNDDFETPDAQVVCRQLGYRGGTVSSSSYGPGTRDIWMDSVSCTGQERRLADCRFNGWGITDCFHAEDVGVQCSPPIAPPSLSNIPEGKVRLSGGTATRGRVEIFHDGRWGTVCDESWGEADARVVCRMIGLRYHRPIAIPAFGGGTGQIWMDIVNCRGEENSLSQCPFRGWGQVGCGHRNDAGVECKSPWQASEGDIRLVNGPAFAGRVEIYHNNRWGTVCSDDFDTQDAQVVCRQLQYRGGRVVSNTYGAGAGDIWMDGLRCAGHERRLAACTFNGWGIQDCTHTKDVGVQCTSPSTLTTRAPPIERTNIRLVNGRTKYEGRVEVYYHNRWGTVCDDDWNTPDAQVVCRSLGFSGGVATTGANFGQGIDPTWLDRVQCKGSESSLFQCIHRGWGVESCSHAEDAGVRCTAKTTTPTPRPSSCDPAAALLCTMPLTRALANVDIAHLSSVCSVYTTFKQCVSRLPRVCQIEINSKLPQTSLQQVEKFCGTTPGTNQCDTVAAMACLKPYTTAMENMDPVIGVRGVCGAWRTFNTCLNALPGRCQDMLPGLGVEYQRDMMIAACGA